MSAGNRTGLARIVCELVPLRHARTPTQYTSWLSTGSKIYWEGVRKVISATAEPTGPAPGEDDR